MNTLKIGSICCFSNVISFLEVHIRETRNQKLELISAYVLYGWHHSKKIAPQKF